MINKKTEDSEIKILKIANDLYYLYESEDSMPPQVLAIIIHARKIVNEILFKK